ncbi:MAG: branched-chain-amino-acid transaminase [Armatimonadota bacterium]
MSADVYIDGQFHPKEEAKISVFDHGLLYGDGVFEGIRAYDGRIFRLEAHLDRLWDSADSIGLELPVSRREITEALKATLRHNGLRDAYVRLVVTRGIGDLGLDPRRCSEPSLIIITDAIQMFGRELYETGVALVLASMRRSARDGVNPSVKCLNYLGSIVAKIEANRAGATEALMLNTDDYVAECTAENIFFVKDGGLVTPPGDAGILRGVTRQVVLECAERLGLPAAERLFKPDELCNADECFITGTAAEVVPVATVDGQAIGDGVPGPVTDRLSRAFRQVTQSEGTPIYE